MDCRHIRADYTCAAFPAGIPADIVAGLDHTASFPGDGGLRFEPRPPAEPAPDFQDLMLEEVGDMDDSLDAYVQVFRREPLRFMGVNGPVWAAHLRRCVAENNPDLDAHADLPPDCVA